MKRQDAYECHKCEVRHTTGNMVAYCASCYTADLRSKDAEIAEWKAAASGKTVSCVRGGDEESKALLLELAASKVAIVSKDEQLEKMWTENSYLNTLALERQDQRDAAAGMAEAAKSESDDLRSKVLALEAELAEAKAGAFVRVAEEILLKVREIEFKAGRCLTDAFIGNNLPSTTYSSDTVRLHRDQLKKFRDDFSLMTAYLAWHIKSPNVSPIDLIGPLRAALKDAERPKS